MIRNISFPKLNTTFRISTQCTKSRAYAGGENSLCRLFMENLGNHKKIYYVGKSVFFVALCEIFLISRTTIHQGSCIGGLRARLCTLFMVQILCTMTEKRCSVCLTLSRFKLFTNGTRLAGSVPRIERPDIGSTTRIDFLSLYMIPV